MQQTTSDDLGRYFESGWRNERLDSWKEIAEFLRREVRTVQLWEKREGLPVRRQHHTKLGTVYAFRRELEQWWISRSASSAGFPTSQEGQPQAGADATINSAVQAANSILPLPFDVIHNSGDRNQVRSAMTAFADELRDQIAMILTQAELEPIMVSSKALPSPETGSPSLLKTVAKEFGAALLLRATVRYSGTIAQVFVQLLDGSDLRAVWSCQSECNLAARRHVRDWFATESMRRAIQHRAVRQQTTIIKATAEPQILAQSAYHLGVHFWEQRNQASLLKAVSYFEEALAFDPNCAEAYAGLANAYVSVSFNHLTSPKRRSTGLLGGAESAYLGSRVADCAECLN